MMFGFGTDEDGIPEIPDGMPDELVESLHEMVAGMRRHKKFMKDVDKPTADELRISLIDSIMGACVAANTKERPINRASQTLALLDATATYLSAQMAEDLTVNVDKDFPLSVSAEEKQAALGTYYGLWQMLFAECLAHQISTASELIDKHEATKEVESMFAGFGTPAHKTD